MATPQGERGEPPRDELVRVLAQRNCRRRIAKQPGESLSHALGLSGGLFPLVVDEFSGVKPCALLRVEAGIRPRLVRVAGEQQTLRHAETRVVRREWIHSWARISQRSGNRLRPSVERKYAAPLDPPVPVLAPIVRSTILT